MQNKTLINIDIITAVPEIFPSFLSSSIPRIAVEKSIAKINTHNLHDYADNTFGHIDDAPFGGAAGMLIKCQPFFDCIEKLQQETQYDEIIYFSADGEKITQSLVNELSLKNNLMLLCGHYKGIDQRIRDTFVTREISMGDFILSVRLLPGVISDIDSALKDSFMDGLLEAPQYTRPADFRGMVVPEILLGGHHKKIEEWQLEQSLEKTKKLRPDLYERYMAE
jgi:tRNA (guanine37-N1)-methyltransferase